MTSAKSIDGTEVVYKRHGEGQPLIFLHGGMAPREYWNPIVPHFEEYAAVIPQRPGFGTCLDDVAETSPEDILNRETTYVRALVEAVQGQPILIGHSYGALTAIESATDAAVEAVLAYEPAVLPDEFRDEANLADRMARLIEAGDRQEAVKRYIEQVLHPDGIDDLDGWLAEWPVWPGCVELAEEVVRMNRAVEQYQRRKLPHPTPSAQDLGPGGWGFDVDSRQSVSSNRPVTRAVQRPTIYTQVYCCVSAPRLGRGTESVCTLPSVS